MQNPPGRHPAGHTLLRQTAPWADTPRRWPLQQTVCILRECILVIWIIITDCKQSFYSHLSFYTRGVRSLSRGFPWQRPPPRQRTPPPRQRPSETQTLWTETPRDPLDRDPPCTVKSGRYTYYWNACVYLYVIGHVRCLNVSTIFKQTFRFEFLCFLNCWPVCTSE